MNRPDRGSPASCGQRVHRCDFQLRRPMDRRRVGARMVGDTHARTHAFFRAHPSPSLRRFIRVHGCSIKELSYGRPRSTRSGDDIVEIPSRHAGATTARPAARARRVPGKTGSSSRAAPRSTRSIRRAMARQAPAARARFLMSSARRMPTRTPPAVKSSLTRPSLHRHRRSRWPTHWRFPTRQARK
jgi:hypothetical protein